MNMLKKGPDLKMPAIKVPDFLLDLYYDLRERRLLPLVAILIVAIVALPIALSTGSDSEEESVVATPSASVPTSTLVVAKSTPGLRDYHRRLEGTPKDPFESQPTTPAAEEGGGTTGTAASEISSTPSESSSAPTESTSPETTSPSQTETKHAPANEGKEDNGEPSSDEQLQYYSFAIDVRIAPASSGANGSKAEPSTRRNLPELTMLPGREEPALTFMDVSKDEKKALMLVSDKVTGLFGDGVCVVGSEHCQLLALEPGTPETVVYGPQGHSFRIELLKIRLLSTDKLQKAPLSKSEEKGNKPKGSNG